MEKREAVVYARTKPSVKNWLYNKMKQDGWENFSSWFNEYISDLMEKDKKKTKKKKQ